MRRLRAAALIAVLAATPLSVVPASAQAPPPMPTAAADPTRTVTLITGDQVMVAGDQVVGVRMAQSRRHIRYAQYRLRNHDHVLPVDAAPLVAKGVLDSRLFDVTTLLQQGFDDASAPAVPTILRTDPGRAARVPEVSSTTRAMARLGLTAVSTPKAKAASAWRELLPTMQSGATSKVWLNGRVSPNLDQSVAQIGAPAAWRAGLRGDGVRVAVLDTGYDATHPDLKSIVDAEQDFTPDNNPRLDSVGHGTHVAGTIAGRGTASGGRYTGVAPGARLLVGKVLTTFGGLEDWVIAGMQWAVDNGAKVVNLSLGSGPTDGTDPLSQVVNQLSESSGALFVIAAGNFGAPGSVSSPGTADRALTVGSVTKSDQLSVFSSRGPRVGDYGLKPEISAPGSDIVAARAAGRFDDVSVGEHYARLSGTSMATPHVAGAAAILAGQHPDWTGEQLKSALVGSAKRLAGIDTHGQGAGRLDVARAVSQRVRADGAAGFGQVWFEPGTPSVHRKVSYTNDGDRPVRLRLTVDARDRDGRPAPRDLFTVDSEWLTVPARSSASVTVSARSAEQPAGEFSGVLTATGHDVVLNTPLSAQLAGRKHELTVRTEPRAGQELYFSLIIVQNEETGWSDGLVTIDGVARFTAPAGRYRTIGYVYGTDNVVTMFAQPAAVDTEIRAEQGKRISASIDDPEAEWTFGGGHAIQSDVDGPGPGRMEFVTIGGPLTERFHMYTIGGPQLRGLRFSEYGHWWHPFVRAQLQGPGGFAFDQPYAPWPLDLPGQLTARLIDVGEADQASIERAGDLTGAIALIGPADWSNPVYPPEEQLRSGIELVKRKGGKAIASFFNPSIDDETPPLLPTVLLFNPVDMQQAQNLVRQRPVDLSLTVRPNSPVSYFLADAVEGSLPAGHEFRYQRAGLGRFEHDLVDTMPADRYRFQNAFWGRGDLIARADVETRWPNRRTDYVSAGSTFWMTAVTGFTDDGEFGWSDTIPATLRAGEVRANRVLGAPFGPELTTTPVSSQDGKPIPWAYRQGDRLTMTIPMFADANPANSSWPDHATLGTTVLFKDGKEIARRDDRPALGTFDLPRGPGRYTLVADANRPVTTLEPALGTKSKAEWNFRVGAGTDRREALPLLDVRFDMPLDDHNRAAVGALTGTVTVAHQPGAKASRVRTLRVEVSYDDGRTWQRVDDRRDGDRWQVRIPAGGAAGGYASLRATASDVDGNAVTETMIRGYALRSP